MSTSTTSQTLPIADVKRHLDELVNEVSQTETRIVVEQGGVPVAGIVSPPDLRRLDQLDQERAERFRILEEFGEAFRDVPAEELEREIARAMNESQSRRRREGLPQATARRV